MSMYEEEDLSEWNAMYCIITTDESENSDTDQSKGLADVNDRDNAEEDTATESDPCANDFEEGTELPVKTRKKPGRKKTVFEKVKKIETPSECTICARVFTTLRSMQRHHRIIHELADQVNCKECGKQFGGKDNLRTHFNTVHLKLRNFACDTPDCDMRFPSGTALKNHVRKMHPPPECDYHKIQFETIAEFEEHIQTEHIQKFCQ